MAKKISLHEFQSYLAARLAGSTAEKSAGLLGVQAGSDYWLLDLADSGEIVPLTPLTAVPLTKPWFAGIANIRGSLYSVIDLSAFLGNEATPKNATSRLLLIGTRYGTNAALLVTRMVGLRYVEALTPQAPDGRVPAWAREAYTDNEGRHWKKIKVRELLSDGAFMDIGV
ncbi:MAG TPA: chemotaxis protein CheW [Accumulibacter sp.]|uniref:chemotaxis protein CheW n=1 Tax=Accumulibacter sp. TaxID=2053492 RepID=UPI002601C877|nr:chemotaxis protein CheW [Accumulibacter sp.]MDS4055192.1 chemotaxis protein CheW [Accumulibacter sp.]HMV04524.1 chemotaxis protein CheW [Accumulibacter sp.]HMW62491.1 chemotaxis protein CheW [Accumulibacter sp.]HMW79005.1 chemotaxis protein CheW [Accumulibacter sp.]HMX67493.1 chemotaxis protein CheW [Accumulibacter sp.]